MLRNNNIPTIHVNKPNGLSWSRRVWY
jgi:hypothetical protein